MSTINHKEFYNRIVHEYGLFDDFSKFIDCSDFPNGDPEVEYQAIIKKISSVKHNTLDIGCGDGTFTKKIAPLFNSIVGVDISDEIIKLANKINQTTKVKFLNEDFKQTKMKPGLFDLVLNRRGPSTYFQINRVLKSKAHYVELAVGNNDSISLKDCYFSNSNYEKWPIDTEKWKREALKNEGVSIIFSKTFLYTDYFKDFESFIEYLRRVPILNDSIDSHLQKIEKYSRDHTRNGHIFLDRHRVLIHGFKV